MTLLVHWKSSLCHMAIYVHIFAFVSLLTVEHCKKWWINKENCGSRNKTCMCGLLTARLLLGKSRMKQMVLGLWAWDCLISSLLLMTVCYYFFFLKAWEMVQCRVYTESKSFILHRSDGVDTAAEAACDNLTPLRSSPAPLLPVS